jgi:hypothetical protein
LHFEQNSLNISFGKLGGPALSTSVGEVVAGSAPELVFSQGEIEFGLRLKTAGAKKLHPLGPKARQGSFEFEVATFSGLYMRGLKKEYLQVVIRGEQMNRRHLAEGDPRPLAGVKGSLAAEVIDVEGVALFNRSHAHKDHPY